MTRERSLVVACHINYGESGASISDVNPLAGCDLSAAVQPEEGRERSRGGAGQTDGAVEFQQLCGARRYYNIGDIRYR